MWPHYCFEDILCSYMHGMGFGGVDIYIETHRHILIGCVQIDVHNICVTSKDS